MVRVWGVPLSSSCAAAASASCGTCVCSIYTSMSFEVRCCGGRARVFPGVESVLPLPLLRDVYIAFTDFVLLLLFGGGVCA